MYLQCSNTTKEHMDQNEIGYVFSGAEVEEIQTCLLQWYAKNKRDLPWRRAAATKDAQQHAYAVWVSEIMLQQTRVATVVNYYERWMLRWPTVTDLSAANLEQVNEVWAGLGYYSRARRLYEGAVKVMTKLDGKIPENALELRKEIPGVGRYTAAAIASIAFDESAGVLDGNVIRVLCRLLRIGGDSTDKNVLEHLWSQINLLIPNKQPGDFNQAIMELGALVCTPKNPICDACPLRTVCKAYKEVKEYEHASPLAGFQNKKRKDKKRKLSDNNNKYSPKKLKLDVAELEDIESYSDHLTLPSCNPWIPELGVMNYPRKPQKKPPRQECGIVCVVEWHTDYKIEYGADNCNNKKVNSDVKYLLTQRPKSGLLAGLWEFPTMMLTPEELSSTAFQRSFSKKKDPSKSSNAYITKMTDTMLNKYLLGFIISERKHVGELVHIFSHIHLRYIVQHVVITTVKNENADNVENVEADVTNNISEGKWINKDDLPGCAVSSAMHKILKLCDLKLVNFERNKGNKILNQKKQMKLESFFTKNGT